MSDAASRLERSRQAIIEQFAQPSQRPGHGRPDGWFARLGAAASRWWQSHPAHLALELATPLLSRYADRSPWRFLAVAFASGALLAVTRPWRLLSVSLFLAAAKSSRLSGLLLSALASLDGAREPRE